MKRFFFVLGHIVIGAGILAGLSAIIMLLWNLLVPSITAWTAINFWQALGLLVLGHLICGLPMHAKGGHGMHGHLHKGHMSREERAQWDDAMMKMREQMRTMTREERMAFLHERFGNPAGK